MPRLGVKRGVDGRRINQSSYHTIIACQRQLVVKRLHHSNQCKLGRAVIRHVTKAKEACTAGDAHNVTMISAEHSWQKLLENPVAGEQVDAECRHEVFLFAFDERFEILNASVVDDDGHVADVSSNALADGTDFFAASQVTVVGINSFAIETVGFDQIDCFCVFVVIDVNEHEDGASLGELNGQLSSKSFSRSGDEDDLVSDVLFRRREDKVKDRPKDAFVEFPDEKEELDEKGDSRTDHFLS